MVMLSISYFVPKSPDSTDETLFMQLKQLKVVFSIQNQSLHLFFCSSVVCMHMHVSIYNVICM